MQVEGGWDDLPQGHPTEDHEDWIKWRGYRVKMPNWWQELVGIPGINNFWELTWKIRASFELPWMKNEDQNVDNVYSAPPAPKWYLTERLLTTSKPDIPLSRYQGGGVSKDFGLCTSPAVLGRKVQTAYAQLTLPFGRVHAGVEMDNGAICGLL